MVRFMCECGKRSLISVCSLFVIGGNPLSRSQCLQSGEARNRGEMSARPCTCTAPLTLDPASQPNNTILTKRPWLTDKTYALLYRLFLQRRKNTRRISRRFAIITIESQYQTEIRNRRKLWIKKQFVFTTWSKLCPKNQPSEASTLPEKGSPLFDTGLLWTGFILTVCALTLWYAT